MDIKEKLKTGRNVRIFTTDKKIYNGVISSFDKYSNILIKNCELDGSEILKDYLINGQMICYVEILK